MLTCRMNPLHLLNILLWIHILLGSSDGKGGGGGNDAVSLVTITQVGAVRIGGDLTLLCTFSAIKKPHSILWFKENDIIYADYEITVFKSPRVQAPKDDYRVTRRHKLVLKSVSLDDEDIYKCTVRPKGQAVVTGTFTATISPHKITVMPLQNIRLPCGANDTVVKLLMWKKDLSIVIFNKTVIDNNPQLKLNVSDLIIVNATTTNAGAYTCYRDGKRIIAYQLVIFSLPTKTKSSLDSWRGIVFGVMLGTIILGILGYACWIQTKPFKGARHIVLNLE